jgi:hypothetical protein
LIAMTGASEFFTMYVIEANEIDFDFWLWLWPTVMSCPAAASPRQWRSEVSFLPPSLPPSLHPFILSFIYSLTGVSDLQSGHVR